MTMTPRIAELQEHLQREIKAAYDAVKNPPLSSAEVSHIVRHIIESLGENVTQADRTFYTELEELARYIRQAKLDIAAIQPKDISLQHIPTATDELDAVVGATEEATNKIMDVCDEVSAIAETCSAETKEKLIACTTKVFEACNFQDITGQRITKVVETLKYIDTRIEALAKAMGDEILRDGGKDGHGTKHIHAADPEKALLNGPQLASKAASQDDIDRLLSGG